MDDLVAARLRTLEESLWLPESRFDREHLEAMLAVDFREYGRSGRVYGRDEILASPPIPFEATLPLPDFQARMIGSDVALVTYRSELRSGDTLETANRCSIWHHEADGWRLEFHQGTPTPQVG
jgi:hypothetical protein